MYNLKKTIYKILPNFLQNILISIYNIGLYRKRYGGEYKFFLNEARLNDNLTFKQLKIFQKNEFIKLLNYAVANSFFYKDLYKEVKIDKNFNDINLLPIVNKEILRNNISKVYTVSRKGSLLVETGGTTGKSLEVLVTYRDTQKGFAILDNFRSKFGYKLGSKTAWFSGKDILNNRDLTKNRFWKTDTLNNVRYYSTFHIKENNLKFYILNMIKFKPEFLVGFPSTMYEIANYGLRNRMSFPDDIIKAIFPTAETLTVEMREVIKKFFKAKIYNQYASSEGAPCIFECKHNNFHIEMQHGIFECLDDLNQPAKRGRLIVTSFTSYGTPLIRYDIGDGITLSEKICDCGNNNPLIENIEGRVSDFVYSQKNGKINLGNISNCLKGVKEVIKFQLIQKKVEEIDVKLIVNKDFNEFYLSQFKKNLRDRLGVEILINFEFVDEIKNEKSGKFRMVKNLLPVNSF